MSSSVAERPASCRRCRCTQYILEQGDRFTHTSAGGGGFGAPRERDPAAVLEDVLDGKVSVVAARDRYGVVLADGEVDVEATLELRAAR